MLSMDPARVLGFRDSYLFFIKNPHLIRVITTVEERTWMIREGLLMANFKSKLIALVTARSIFKTFGHRIIKNGRSRVDDYYEAAAEDEPMESYDREASTQVEEGSVAGDDTIATSRRKRALDQSEENARPITGLNWMYESALTVRALNTQLKTQRKDNPRFMDPHTNIEQIPAALQPTRCVVKMAPDTVDRKPVIRRQPSLNTEGSTDTAEVTGAAPLVSKVATVPRSIGPKIDTNVKIEIKAGAPGPPIINDPNVWAVIPEDIRKAIEEAEAPTEDEEDPNQHKFPISLMPGHYQSAYPV